MLARNGAVIRTANLADIAELVRIENTCFDGDRLSRRSLMRLIRRGSAVVFVAALAGRIAAYAVTLFRRNSRIARLYSLAVDPQFAGNGLGGRLVAAAEKESRRRDCNRMQLEVRTGNARAIALYERLGFVCCGIREGYYTDGRDAYRYARRLTGTAL
jgi:[ribosomal protein S18]-alanine N-acetyltransferase